MEVMLASWVESQSWFSMACVVVTIASSVTLTLKDEYAEKLPIIGKIWPILNWMSLNVFNNKNEKKRLYILLAVLYFLLSYCIYMLKMKA